MPDPPYRTRPPRRTPVVLTLVAALLSVLAPTPAYAATPALAVSTTSYDAESPALSGTVTYLAVASVTAAAPVDGAISLTQTVPTGVTPLSAYGTGWVCQAPSGRTITCTTTGTTFTASQVLATVTVAASVTASGVTGAIIRSASTTLVQATGATQGTDTVMSAGTLSSAPAVTLTPTAGTAVGGNVVTVGGSGITSATVIQVGTTADLQAGTAVVLNRCLIAGAGCFTVGTSTLTISSMPAQTGPSPVTVLVATRGVATAANYVYAEKPAAPDAPTAVAGVASATVTWAAPASNGGSPVTGYVVTPYRNGVVKTASTFDASTTTRTLTALSANYTYTFKVAAINAAGTGTASALSVGVLVYNVPSTPSAPTAKARDYGAAVTWAAPANGGSPITGYVVTPYIGTTAQTPVSFPPTPLTQTISGLTVGTAYTFTVSAQNMVGSSPTSAKSTVAVTPTVYPTLVYADPPGGTVSTVYSYQQTVTGGATPFVWSLASGALPTGITMSTSTGLLSGTPTVSGTFNFTVKVTDASAQIATRPVTIAIIGKPAAPAAPTAVAGVLSATVTWVAPASNGSTITGYTVTPFIGSTAKTATTYDASTTTRTVTGLAALSSYTFKVAAINTYGTGTASAASNAVTVYTVPGTPTVGAAKGRNSSASLSWTAPSSNGGSAITGYVVTPYVGTTAQPAQTFTGTATTQIVTGLSPGTTYTFTVAAQNLAGTGSPSLKSAAVTVNNAPSLTFPDPAAGEVGVVYSVALTVTGGTTPFVWTVSSGALPPGLTLNASTGLLSGTPTEAGSYDATIQVVDFTNATATRAVTLVIAEAPVLIFTPDPGEVGVAYSQQPTVTGGTTPFVWAVTAGSLPSGVTLNPSTGLLSGTPSAAGTFSVTLSATDALGKAAVKTLALVIAALPTLTFSAPASGQVGVAYSINLSATGGTAPLTWSIAAGSTPPGLALNATTGALSGTPTTVGTSTFTVGVTDVYGKSATKAASLVIAAGPLVIVKTANTSSVVAGATVGYTITFTNTGTLDYTGLALTDPLAGVLDDAAYDANAVATAGSLAYVGSTLSWTGDLAAGEMVTISYSVTVANPVTGNKVLGNTVTSPVLGTNCASGSVDPRCTATVTVAGLSITKTSDVATSIPGGVVRYTILVTNSGKTPLVGATLSDSLVNVLDDATYRGDGSSTTGSVSYSSPVLTWTGNLAVGAAATITYSVAVANPDVGNRTLAGTVVSPTPGSSCPSGNPATSCTTVVTIRIPALVITTSAGVSTSTPGATVPYVVRLANTGETAYPATGVNLALAGALDDASYDGFTSSAGSLAFNAGTGVLVWTGSLALGAVVTISGSVTVNNPDRGNKTVTLVATSAAAGSTCVLGTTNPACTANVPVKIPQLSITSAADTSSTIPESVVTYTVSLTNTGQTAYVGATLGVALGDTLDDATYNGDATATAGTVGFSSPTLTWTGDLAIGASVNITYSVTVNDPDTGNHAMLVRVSSTTPGSNCAPGSVDARCAVTVTVLIPGLNFTNVADVTTTTPGSVVRFTVTASNTGEADLDAIEVTLDLDGLVDDAAYNYDATTSTGSLQPHADGTVFWVLDLAPGESATGILSFTVLDPDLGDRQLHNIVRSDAPGSECPTGPVAPSCESIVQVLVPGLTITKSASANSVTPGDTVDYTITVVNDGQTAYPNASFTDSLDGVLTDATYNGDATVDIGAVSYTGSLLSWTGRLDTDDSATISYSVTVLEPDPGDKRLTNTVQSSAANNNCAINSGDLRCTAVVDVLVPGLTFTKTADQATTAPGGRVGYTVGVRNTGATAVNGAAFTDVLDDVLDDADYNSDAAASSGTVSSTSNTIRWTGDLLVGASATITYSVTVQTADLGDDLLINQITSASRGTNNCSSASIDPRCTTTVGVARLTLSTSYTEATSTPGSLVHAHSTYRNTGQVPYVDIIVNFGGDDIVDDAISNGDQAVSSGRFVLTATDFYWQGSIAPGEVVTGGGTLTVLDPDPGNQVISGTIFSGAAGSNCTSAFVAVGCRALTDVLTPDLTITKSANTTTAVPGGVVSYTVTLVNTGQTPYTGARLNDSLSGVLDDAVYDANAVATSGTLGYSSPVLSWTGNLSVGQQVTITYSVTVRSPDPGDKSMVNSVVSDDVGSNCAATHTDASCRSSVDVLTPALTIVKTADLDRTTLGSTVAYTVLVTNSGQTPYPAAAFSDSLVNVLDDASYNAGATSATRGSTSYDAGVLSWSGALSVGQSARITYTVTVSNPASGDRSLRNTIVSSAAGSNCSSTSSDARCTAVVSVANSVTLTFTKTADVDSTAGNEEVNYTVTVTNSSALPVVAANFTDPLTQILDDATYNSDALASSGVVTFTSPNLTWVGTIPASTTVTVTYSVTVHGAITGDQILSGRVSSTSVPASDNCLVDSTDPRCANTMGVARLDLTQTATEVTTTPGSTVHVTAAYTNTGKVPYDGISVVSPRADTSDDTIPTGDQVASSGTLVRTAAALTWTGSIPVGGVVTTTRTLRVKDPDTGDQDVTATIFSDAPGNNCVVGTTDPRCTFSVAVLTPALMISTTADTPAIAAGNPVNYSVTIHNTGTYPYVGAKVSGDLTGVLDDATYNGNATVTSGSLVYTSPVLTWTGSIAPNATVVITYSVIARRPATGDKTMVGFVSSAEVGNNCPAASGNPECRSTVLVLTSGLTLSSTTNVSTSAPGATVSYTITATNTGQVPLDDAVFTVGLAGVLDDAAYNNNVSASIGTAAVAASVLTWTGDLTFGQTATITYTVTVAKPVLGNSQLEQTVISADDGSNCPVGTVTAPCATTVLIAGLKIVHSADVAVTAPTKTVRYTSTFTNTGKTPYVGISITDDLTGVFDDATYAGDTATTAGSVAISLGTGKIVWTGDLAVGAVVTVTASVVVSNPDPGNKVLTSVLTTAAVASSCPTTGGDTSCTATVTVLIPALTITKSANTTTTTPGAIVGYTITATNTGQTGYVGAKLSDALGGVRDDATFTGATTATRGVVTVTTAALSWAGDLALGQSVTIAYSLKVDSPDLGDKTMVNPVTSDEVGSTCPTGGSGSACVSFVSVLIPGLAMSVVANGTTTTPGAGVSYTATIRNTGETPYVAASAAIALGAALDDASYPGGAMTTRGAVTFASPVLSWTGDLPVGATAIITYTLTVLDPDIGNRLLTTVLTSAAPGSNCLAGSTDPACTSTVTVLIPGLAVSTTANLTTATPGDPVTFTITVANTGQTPYEGTTVSAGLSGVLDDATFTGAISASSGVASYAAPTLSWSGSLAAGETAVITYTVTVRSPDPGDKLMSTTVVAPAQGSTCQAGSASPSCTVSVTVLVPQLTITKTAGVSTTTPGATVNYTIVISNTGQTAYTAAVVSDSLRGLLTEADYTSNATVVGGGVLSYTSPVLRWTGNLLVGASATISYSVTVHNPDTGDKLMTNAVTSSSPGSTCPVGGSLPACSAAVRVLVPALVITKTADLTTVTAGSPVNYTVTVTNTGETAYAPASFSDSLLTGVLDDATYAGGAVATSGSVQYTNNTLAWSGSLGLGATATISYSVTTRFPATGDRSLVNTVLSSSPGSNCGDGSDARCRSTVAVIIPALTLAKTADTTAVVAGGTVHYTISATNTGAADYPDASISDSLVGVLDDGAYAQDAVTSRGTLSYANSSLSWTGPLPIGATVLITYSVTVDVVDRGNAALDNRVVSTSFGSTCPPAASNPSCVTSVVVSASTLSLTDLTPAFTLAGAPGDTAEQEDAVTMTVTTNSFGGYAVTVQAAQDAMDPQTPGHADRIPIELLEVRENGTSDFSPLSADHALTVHQQNRPSQPHGDAVSNDYRMQIPFVESDTYTTTLDYIVTAQ